MKKNLFILGMMVSSIYYAQNTGSTQLQQRTQEE